MKPNWRKCLQPLEETKGKETVARCVKCGQQIEGTKKDDLANRFQNYRKKGTVEITLDDLFISVPYGNVQEYRFQLGDIDVSGATLKGCALALVRRLGLTES